MIGDGGREMSTDLDEYVVYDTNHQGNYRCATSNCTSFQQ
jgi:hypothetical protein